MQWEGMDDEEAPYLMKEFHEHLGKRESQRKRSHARASLSFSVCVCPPRLALAPCVGAHPCVKAQLITTILNMNEMSQEIIITHSNSHTHTFSPRTDM